MSEVEGTQAHIEARPKHPSTAGADGAKPDDIIRTKEETPLAPEIKQQRRRRMEEDLRRPGNFQFDIPAATPGERESDKMDPAHRAAVASSVKWVFILGILACFIAVKAILWRAWEPYTPTLWKYTVPQEYPQFARDVGMTLIAGIPQKKWLYDLWPVHSVLAALCTAVLLRLFPRFLGRYREVADNVRDGLVIGLLTGIFIGIGIVIARLFLDTNGVESEDANEYWLYRSWLVFLVALVSVALAQGIALYQEREFRVAGWKLGISLFLHALGIALLYYPLDLFCVWLIKMPLAVPIASVAALGMIGSALGVLVPSYQQDKRLRQLIEENRKNNHPDAQPLPPPEGKRVIELKITIIGGRESGKTVLLLGAYWEWFNFPYSNFVIKPVDIGSGDRNMSELAQRLYNRPDLPSDDRFPAGTTRVSDFVFDMVLDTRDVQETVARFHLLDYPGGALRGRAEDKRWVDDFWNRVDDSDAVIVILDMSAARLGNTGRDWEDVRRAYTNALRRILKRNGRNRIVPIAFVLTKCDEFPDYVEGGLDNRAIDDAVMRMGYDQLVREWVEACKEFGPDRVVLQMFRTSAITYSVPRRDSQGREDESKPFSIPDGEAPTPANCARPLLWLTSQTLRWNRTLHQDFRAFLFGHDPRVQAQQIAALKLTQTLDARKAELQQPNGDQN